MAQEDTVVAAVQAVCLPDHRLLLLHKRMQLLPVRVVRQAQITLQVHLDQIQLSQA